MSTGGCECHARNITTEITTLKYSNDMLGFLNDIVSSAL